MVKKYFLNFPITITRNSPPKPPLLPCDRGGTGWVAIFSLYKRRLSLSNFREGTEVAKRLLKCHYVAAKRRLKSHNMAELIKNEGCKGIFVLFSENTIEKK